MSDHATFLSRMIAARNAAWIVFLIGFGIQLLAYGAYLGMGRGWLDGLIEGGVYGDVTRDELARIVFVYVAALKLMNTAIFMGAIFLTLWVRGVRRIG